jgi:hypothetical protein
MVGVFVGQCVRLGMLAVVVVPAGTGSLQISFLLFFFLLFSAVFNFQDFGCCPSMAALMVWLPWSISSPGLL